MKNIKWNVNFVLILARIQSIFFSPLIYFYSISISFKLYIAYVIVTYILEFSILLIYVLLYILLYTYILVLLFTFSRRFYYLLEHILGPLVFPSSATLSLILLCLCCFYLQRIWLSVTGHLQRVQNDRIPNRSYYQ